VITDLDFVRESLALIANGIGRSLKVRDLENPFLRGALVNFLLLKKTGPLRIIG